MKHFYMKGLTLSAFFLSLFTLSQGQTTQSTSSKAPAATPSVVRADGFPVMQNTGNRERDIARYETAKKEWIAKNPEKYTERQKGNVVKTKVTRKELNTLPEERRNYILTHPELYIIE